MTARYRCIAALLSAFLLLGLTAVAWANDGKGTPEAKAHFDKAEAALQAKDFPTAIAEYRKAIDIDPDFVKAHEQFMSANRMANRGNPEAAEKANKELLALYEGLAKEHPKSAVIQYEIGSFYSYKDFATQEKYCLKAIKLDPKFAPAYMQLSLISEFKGDKKASREYLKKATESDPQEPSYAFYYSHTLKDGDEAKYRKAALEVAERFPTHERGAQSLYWLAADLDKTEDKIAILEKLRKQYPPEKSGWSSSGMSNLFDIYAKSDPQKALTFAQEMAKVSTDRERQSWDDKVVFQQALVDARKLLAEKKAADAAALLEKTKVPRYSEATGFNLLKAEAADVAGDTAKAYDSLLKVAVDKPTDTLNASLLIYATKLKKSAKDVEADLWQLRSAKATPAAPFNLSVYGSDKKASLEDFKGKVVLLNFWYPA